MALLNCLRFTLLRNKWKRLGLNLFALAPLQSAFKTVARVILLNQRSWQPSAQDSAWLLFPRGVRTKSLRQPTGPCLSFRNIPPDLLMTSLSSSSVLLLAHRSSHTSLFVFPGLGTCLPQGLCTCRFLCLVFSPKTYSHVSLPPLPKTVSDTTFLMRNVLIAPYLKLQTSSTPNKLFFLFYSILYFLTYLIICLFIIGFIAAVVSPLLPTSSTSQMLEHIVLKGRDRCLFCSLSILFVDSSQTLK